ncbi:MAG: twin-arginine translocase TatA/TatE family subunit [Bacteroidetes bacterium QS_1_65_9]|jgi:sec-independent protein translocase protein TatA|nr:MAG: twin-arginine translocase TatA/TatE family subunit [Bacteroidetes bacterium QS_1_65_9]
MFGTLGPFELILIFLVVLLIFGANRIPEIARGVGKGIREFKSATNEIKSEMNASENQRKRQKIQEPEHGEPNPRGPAPEQQPTSEEPPAAPESAQNPSPKTESET